MITVFFPYLGSLFRRCLFSSVYPVSQSVHLGVDIPGINSEWVPTPGRWLDLVAGYDIQRRLVSGPSWDQPAPLLCSTALRSTRGSHVSS